jgi:hypothetical protein
METDTCFSELRDEIFCFGYAVNLFLPHAHRLPAAVALEVLQCPKRRSC